MLAILISLASNLAALLIAERLINTWIPSGFSVTHEWIGLAIVVALLTVANSFILPILRFVLKPLIWLTLGILGFALNGVLIYLVDIFSTGLTINGLVPLVLATVVIGATNATISYLTKAFK